jgi:Ala-tRNA(Pro) deacylase
MKNDIYTLLDALAIQYKRIDHAPVYTSAQARSLIPEQAAASAKNLFLKNKKGRKYFLLVFDDKKTLDLKTLASQIEESRLSLASPEQLKTHLEVEPGAVSLFALINDPENRVELLIDRDLWDEAFLQIHPLVNTATLILALADVKRFLQQVGHSARFVDIQ